MDPSRKSRIDGIFGPALDLGPDDRGPWLDRECGADLELRAEVERLLEDHERAGGFLMTPIASLFQGLAPGDEVGRYRIESEIGRGGMGVVYLARDGELGRAVAIKLLLEASWAGGAERAAFQREMRAAASLNHPNIVSVYDVGEQNGRPYLVMEHVPGEPLSALIPPRGLALPQVHKYASGIADALAAAHHAGVIHRDIKPANIMVLPGGLVKVLDFSIARLLHPVTSAVATAGTVAGTPPYMSPEQADGERADARSDVFSFGILLHEMLTGTSSLSEMHRLPGAWATVVLRCVQQDPDRRFQSMDDTRAALARAARASSPDDSRMLGCALAGLVLSVSFGLMVEGHWLYGSMVLAGSLAACVVAIEYPEWAARRAIARKAAQAFRRGRLLIGQNEPVAARAYLIDAIRLAHGSAEAHGALAESYFHTKHYAEAARSYSEALRLARTKSERAAYAFQKGRACALSGDLVQAKIDFTELIESSSPHSGACAERGLLWLRQDERRAAVDFKDGLAHASTSPADRDYAQCCATALDALRGATDKVREALERCEDRDLAERFEEALDQYMARASPPRHH